MQLKRSVNLTPSSAQFIVLTSVLITVIFNYPFISAAYESVSPLTFWDWIFLLTVPLLLTLINIIFLSLFGALLFPRLTVAITFLVSSPLLYASLVYGVVFDSSMIQNVMETNSGEAFSYLNLSFLLFLLLLGLVPVFAILNQDIQNCFTSHLAKMLFVNLLALLGLTVIGVLFYKDYASVGRNNKALVKQIIPYAFYDAGYKYLRNIYFNPPLPYRILDQKPYLIESSQSSFKTVVMVVGETARADKFGVNGYIRNTTPQITEKGAISFANVTSCGTATAVSVPCMFSRLGREQYESRVAESQDNVLDIINRAGTKVTWIDNNSSCKGACNRIETIEFDPGRDPTLCDGDFCYDEILVNLLRLSLSKPPNLNQLIVLHMIGSHGPTYYRRYPKKFARFTPDCQRSDIQNCKEEELINTYDNTIAYTDYVLGNIIEALKTVPNSSMLYLSDHGESLGEKGLYLHGFPYNLAPKEQTHIPMIYWDSTFTDRAYKSCIDQLAHNSFSHDNLYDTLIGLTNVSSVTYQPTMDMFKLCKR
ncbi:phosphoethanolamine--lipid A transferase [Alteromonas pelagimontana]|uniref:Phosphoethanolamine--lipid A transferase n=1 Tax=Alteromonas pelagimontana TaxID=1858656 RepID=A0A6M4MEH7_9ALTE|nr:phosphoethanolamine--lipid A transferase [Alteromonas pelagimontana]QJR81483.1 phosphoethanolamine--lipid A transferase [Alteromonas pelagimontana]